MTDSQTVGVITNLTIGAVGLAIALLVYDVLRYFLPLHAYYREHAAQSPINNNYDGSELHAPTRPSSIPLSWLPKTIMYPERAIAQSHGLDVAMFLRFLSTNALLFGLLSVFTCVLLVPVYVTADNRHRPAAPNFSPPRGIEIASLSNVPDNSYRLWITMLAEVAVIAASCAILFRDIRDFTAFRRAYRADPHNPSNYAVLVLDVPDGTDLAAITNALFPTDVLAIHPVRDAEVLLGLKQRAVLATRRRMLAQSRVREAAPPGSKLVLDRDDRDSDEKPADRLPSAAPAPAHKGASSASASTSHVPLHGHSPRRAASVSPPPPADPRRLTTASSSSPGRRRTTTRRETATAQEEAAAAAEHEAAAIDAVADAEAELDERAPLTEGAIIVLRSKRAASALAAMPFWPSAGEVLLSRAPEPRAVNWNRIDIARRTTRIRQWTSMAVLVGLSVFWTVPSGFIQGLGNFRVLAERWPDSAFANVYNNNRRLATFLEGVLPPLLLFLALLLVPLLVRFVLSFERIASRTHFEAKIRNYLFFFYVMSNFVYVVLFGSFARLLNAIFDNSTNIIKLLSTTVPAQATFLMKYVLINAFLGSTLGMLNLGRLMFRPLVKARAKTELEKRNADRLFAEFPFAKIYALCMMISFISFVYSTIAPLINVVAFAYFSIAYVCNKQLLLYSHRPQFEGGGYLFRDSFTGMLVGVYTHTLAMVGIFSIKRAATQGVLMGIAFVFCLWFTLFCRTRFHSRIKHGSLVDQFNEDEERGIIDVIPDGFADMYVHPGLKPLEVLQRDVDPILAPAHVLKKERT